MKMSKTLIAALFVTVVSSNIAMNTNENLNVQDLLKTKSELQEEFNFISKRIDFLVKLWSPTEDDIQIWRKMCLNNNIQRDQESCCVKNTKNVENIDMPIPARFYNIELMRRGMPLYVKLSSQREQLRNKIKDLDEKLPLKELLEERENICIKMNKLIASISSSENIAFDEFDKVYFGYPLKKEFPITSEEGIYSFDGNAVWMVISSIIKLKNQYERVFDKIQKLEFVMKIKSKL